MKLYLSTFGVEIISRYFLENVTQGIILDIA